MSSTGISSTHPGNSRTAYSLREVDPDATVPHPLPGDAHAARQRRAALDSPAGLAVLLEIVDLACVQRRAQQAAAAYRYAATAVQDGRCAAPDARWYATQVHVSELRARYAADEAALLTGPGTGQPWTRMAAAWAWATVHLDDARHAAASGAPALAAGRRLRAAARRLEATAS
ncbi:MULTISPECIES: hypothetical protein [Streptacidiphilus]|uniref:Uncharacterized protein n=1 Tax=Streptacidiphilus cavernicola TaxID=3342716 RepID=A0ABV6UWH1_9ACTN|nr:hypothetical protein [Streptacidiphilus jeojiense]